MGISLQQAISFAYAAGFRGEQIVTIVSISLCECGSQACGCNPDCCPQSESCGVLQVFQYAHPGTAACAVDPACAYRLGWSLSSHGTNFHPWTTYNNGCYHSHQDAVRNTMAAMPPPIGGGQPPPWCPTGCTGTPPYCSCPPGPVACPPGWTLVGTVCEPGQASSGIGLLPAVLVLGAVGILGHHELTRRGMHVSDLLHHDDAHGGFRDAARPTPTTAPRPRRQASPAPPTASSRRGFGR